MKYLIPITIFLAIFGLVISLGNNAEPQKLLSGSTLQVYQGGTGTSTTPVDLELLVGRGDGSYYLPILTAGSNITITTSTSALTIAASGGSGGSNWNFASINAIKPTTTVGIIVNASSTIRFLNVNDINAVYGISAATTTISGLSITETLRVNAGISTSTSLAANGANCGAGEYPLGIDASGAVESCTDATTEINSVVANYLPLSGGTLTGSLNGKDIALTDGLSAATTTLTGLLTVGTITTGIGETEIYQMNQAVRTTDTITFKDLALTYGISAATGTFSGVLKAETLNINTGISTSSALAANPTNCDAGNYPLGIDASGNVESCTVAGSGGGSNWQFYNATTLRPTSTINTIMGNTSSTLIGDFNIGGNSTNTGNIVIGSDGTAQAGCLAIRDTGGAAWTYCRTSAGTMTCNTTDCSGASTSTLIIGR